MLNKKICILCINSRDAKDKWHCGDDDRWKRGFVYCPNFSDKIECVEEKTVFKSKIPPSYCPYILEHTVNVRRGKYAK